jgi:alpha-beta hydrolase superfamily lysophospholipase
MIRFVGRWTKRFAILIGLVAVTLFGIRLYDTQRGAPLEPWHTFVPHELSRDAIDHTDWAGYLAAEDKLFQTLRMEVTQRLPEADRVPDNRYFEGSPVYPGRFPQDWNRSYVMEPLGPPQGAVVLLHGLTDSPYSLRHVARLYRDRGFVALAIRLPAHGTVPAALTDVEWEDWLAATRLVLREARRRAGPGAPLHIVGFSNGGALAMKATLDALEDASLPRADRLILISPMIGVTSFARFAGIAGWPAAFPAFAKAAWLSIVPEFNPFKYNSFPVNGARQSFRLTQALQRQVLAHSRSGVLEGLPPTLTFQSVMDFTVSTSAVISALYAHLPANGSELVLFDINRTAKFGPLLRQTAETMLARLLPPAPRTFRSTTIANASAETTEVVETVVEAGATNQTTRPLGVAYPRDIYSLSHVAIPFPPSDGLYGFDPDPREDFGVRLGATASRGEVGVLIVALDSLLRISSNPFYSYLERRLDEAIPQAPGRAALPGTPRQ